MSPAHVTTLAWVMEAPFVVDKMLFQRTKLSSDNMVLEVLRPVIVFRQHRSQWEARAHLSQSRLQAPLLQTKVHLPRPHHLQ